MRWNAEWATMNVAALPLCSLMACKICLNLVNIFVVHLVSIERFNANMMCVYVGYFFLLLCCIKFILSIAMNCSSRNHEIKIKKMDKWTCLCYFRMSIVQRKKRTERNRKPYDIFSQRERARERVHMIINEWRAHFCHLSGSFKAFYSRTIDTMRAESVNRVDLFWVWF